MDSSPQPLTAEELERYARHIVLPEVGGAGQQKQEDAFHGVTVPGLLLEWPVRADEP